MPEIIPSDAELIISDYLITILNPGIDTVIVRIMGGVTNGIYEKHPELADEIVRIVQSNTDKIRRYLLQEEYIICTDRSIPRDMLTPKGRLAQKAGGVTKYIEQEESKKLNNMMPEFIKDVRELLHSTPYCPVDITPLINKHTEGQSEHQKSIFKVKVHTFLEQYHQSGLIADRHNYYDLGRIKPTHIPMEDPSVYITGTDKFEESYRRENTPPQKSGHNLSFAGDFKGNLNLGEGEVHQEAFIEERPNIQPTNEPIAPQKNIIQSSWKLVITNPMSASIIGGSIAIVVTTLILKHYHVI